MHKQRCPCGATYSFPNSATGRRAKCVKCGATLTLRPDDEGPIAIAGTAAAPTGTVVLAPVSVASVPLPGEPGFIPPEPIIEEAIVEKPPPGYAQSLLNSLLFFGSVHNLIVFTILWGFLFVGSILVPWEEIVDLFGRAAAFAVIAGMMGKLAIFAWFSAFRLNLIAATAAGDTRLPGTVFADGVMEGLIVPLLRWVGSWVIVLAPMSIALMFVLALDRLPVGISREDAIEMGRWGWLRSGSPELIGVGVLSYAGEFVWPIIVLCMAIGGFGSFGRPDMILDTILRTFPAYLLTVSIVVGGRLVGVALYANIAGDGSAADYVIRHAIATGIEAYLSVIAMSAIGLYYHHFREKFAWSWD